MSVASSDSEELQDQLDVMIEHARAYRDRRLSTLGPVYPTDVYSYIWREYYRNILQAVTNPAADWLREEDFDDNWFEIKMAYQHKRHESAKKQAVQALAEAKAEAKDEADAKVQKALILINECATAALAVNESVANPAVAVDVNTVSVDDDIQGVDEILAHMERLVAVEPIASPTEFAQAFNSDYATEMRRLADCKRATRSATKMRKSGSA